MSKLGKGLALGNGRILPTSVFMILVVLIGLWYITYFGTISHPGEVLKMDQKINVVVLDFDDEKTYQPWLEQLTLSMMFFPKYY
jgi:small subunit ribosomal protein S1